MGSKVKLRDYFVQNVGKVLDSNTQSKVAGTSERARRIRELRNEDGYNIIISSVSGGDMVFKDKKTKFCLYYHFFKQFFYFFQTFYSSILALDLVFIAVSKSQKF